MSSAIDEGPLAGVSSFADRYHVVRRRGCGGMGAVYEAIDTVLDERVALKILISTSGASAASIRRFHREVLLARRVTHPNVVRVHDIGEADGLLYMTMALVDGQSLQELLDRDGPLPLPAALRLFAELVGAVAATHAAGIVHRDLKPGNVLIDRDGRALLADFGIARTHGALHEITATGAVVGTLRYMAPEQLRRGAAVDERADIYALGLLLHETLTGEVPPLGSGMVGDLRVVTGVGDGAILPALERLLERCLMFAPAGRPASASALLLEVEALRASVVSAPSPGPRHDEITAVYAAARQASRTSEAIEATTTPRPYEPRILAVLPFQYVGPPDESYLGQTLAEELVDLLVRLRGIKVLGTGPTSAFVRNRDPRAIGEALRAHWVVDGTIQRSGERVRTVVRVSDARTGEQLCSESIAGTISDTFSFQTNVARVIAEHVRAELTTLSAGANAPPRAIELYLSARRDLGRFEDQERGIAAYEALRESLRLAPGFTPALAALAHTTVRAWFTGHLRTEAHDWEHEADALVAEALERAPEIPETHLATGVLALQRCDFTAAVRALATTLTIAPTHQEAHRYLAMLEMEAGLGDQASTRFRLVAEYDRTSVFATSQIARWRALQHDFAAAGELLAEALRHQPTPSIGG
jgi:serine/threonine protein kinase